MKKCSISKTKRSNKEILNDLLKDARLLVNKRDALDNAIRTATVWGNPLTSKTPAQILGMYIHCKDYAAALLMQSTKSIIALLDGVQPTYVDDVNTIETFLKNKAERKEITRQIDIYCDAITIQEEIVNKEAEAATKAAAEALITTFME